MAHRVLARRAGLRGERVVAPEFRGPVHETTMLRSALDAALQDRYPYFLAAVERLKGRGDPEGRVELLRERVKAVGRGWPRSGPALWTEPDRQTRYVLGTGVERGAFGCSSNRSDTATRTRADVREAARRLAHMPWFGLQHRWLASVCLWHVTTRRPWPAESLPACPWPRQCEALLLRIDDDRRILGGYGVAPASPCVDGVATRAAGAVCPAHVAAARINVVKAGETLSTSTSCLLKALCAAGDASDELLAPLARGGAPDDWPRGGGRIFDARVRAAAGTARGSPVRRPRGLLRAWGVRMDGDHPSAAWRGDAAAPRELGAVTNAGSSGKFKEGDLGIWVLRGGAHRRRPQRRRAPERGRGVRQRPGPCTWPCQRKRRRSTGTRRPRQVMPIDGSSPRWPP